MLVEIAENRSVSAAQVALSWLLGRPGVASVIVGARTDDQLADNLKAAELVLSEEERRRLDEVSAPPLIYPFWHQLKTASDRLGPADLPLLGPHLSEGHSSCTYQRPVWCIYVYRWRSRVQLPTWSTN